MIIKRNHLIVLTTVMTFMSIILNVYADIDKSGVTYYVSKNGNDKNNGLSEDKSFLTISKAAEIATAGDTIIIGGGEYHETVYVNNSGAEDNPIIFKAYPGEQPVLMGADEVTGFTNESNNIYTCDIDMTLGDKNQVFINGNEGMAARFPNTDTNGVFMNTTTVERVDTIDQTENIVLKDFPDVNLENARFWIARGSAWDAVTTTLNDYNGKEKSININSQSDNFNYKPRTGNICYLFGNRELLDSEGEWWYDDNQNKLYIYSENSQPNSVLVKQRECVMDISSVSNIEICGIDTFSGKIKTDKNTNNIKFYDMSILYPEYSMIHTDLKGGLILEGNNNKIINCELAYSAGDLLKITGTGNSVINTVFHDGCYVNAAGGLITDNGLRTLISHCTGYNSGRFILSTKSRAGLVEYNNFYNGSSLTNDSGLIYGCYADFENTVFRYNKIHDNLAKDKANGLYFDWGSTNVILHNNIVYGGDKDYYKALVLTGPGDNFLVYNNTICDGLVDISSDISGSHFVNNIVTNQAEIIGNKNIYLSDNLWQNDDYGFKDILNDDFSLNENSNALDDGAYVEGVTQNGNKFIGACGLEMYEAGANLEKEFNSQYEKSSHIYRNLISNSSFENANFNKNDIQPWVLTNGKLVSEMVWGRVDGKSRNRNYAVSLSDDGAMCEQTITGLLQNTEYTVYVYARNTDINSKAVLGVKNYGGEAISVTSNNDNWNKLTVNFKTGPQDNSATIYFSKIGDEGEIYFDTAGLNIYVPYLASLYKEETAFKSNIIDDYQVNNYGVDNEGETINLNKGSYAIFDLMKVEDTINPLTMRSEDILKAELNFWCTAKSYPSCLEIYDIDSGSELTEIEINSDGMQTFDITDFIKKQLSSGIKPKIKITAKNNSDIIVYSTENRDREKIPYMNITKTAKFGIDGLGLNSKTGYITEQSDVITEGRLIGVEDAEIKWQWSDDNINFITFRTTEFNENEITLPNGLSGKYIRNAISLKKNDGCYETIIGENKLVTFNKTCDDVGIRVNDTVNNGRSDELYVKKFVGSTIEFTKFSLLRFNYNQINPNEIKNAKLVLYANKSGIGSCRISVCEADNSWNENSITFNNIKENGIIFDVEKYISGQPFDNEITSVQITAKPNEKIEIDITDYLKEKLESGEHTISLQLNPISGEGYFYSSECANDEYRPLLVVKYADYGNEIIFKNENGEILDTFQKGDKIFAQCNASFYDVGNVLVLATYENGVITEIDICEKTDISQETLITKVTAGDEIKVFMFEDMNFIKPLLPVLNKKTN